MGKNFDDTLLKSVLLNNLAIFVLHLHAEVLYFLHDPALLVNESVLLPLLLVFKKLGLYLCLFVIQEGCLWLLRLRLGGLRSAFVEKGFWYETLGDR